MLPQAAGPREQLPALLAVKPAEWLVEDHQPHPGPEQRSPQPYSLPLSPETRPPPSPRGVCSPAGSF